MENIAVITGDIINSRKVGHESYDNLLYTLETTFRQIAEGKRGYQFDIYRGDSFQVIIPKLQDVVKSALLLRLALKSEDSSFDARMSIGIGQSDNVRHDVRSSTGEAYTLSGTGLDKLKLNTFAIYTNNIEFQKSIELLTKYLDSNISELTKVQSKALYEYLIADDKSHLSISSTLGKSRVNTTKILNKAKYQLVEDYIKMFNELVSENFNG